MKNQKTVLFSALLASTCLTMPMTARADDAKPIQTAQAAPSTTTNILEEVVVTSARRREEDVQSTPIAVTALDAHLLERSHVTNIDQLSNLAPNLTITQVITTPNVAGVYLRGFGAQSNDPAVDPHVAMFVDGIYQPQLSGTLIDLFDVSQVEVQAGPQGTLLGKNAPIGAVYITTEKPSGDFGGAVEGDYGSYDHVGLRGKINIPIIKDVLAAKFSFVDKQGGNWVRDTLTNKRDLGGEGSKIGRLSVLFTPTPDFDWSFVASALKADTPQPGNRNIGFVGGKAGNSSAVNQPAPAVCGFYPNGLCPLTEYGTSDDGLTTRDKAWIFNMSSTENWRLGPVTLTSVTGYISYWGSDNSDVSGTQFNDLNAYADRLASDEETQELRISSEKGGGWDLDGRLDWVVGGYFSNFSYKHNNNLGIFAPPGQINVEEYQNGTSQSEAVFARAIYNFTDQWHGTLGVRRSWDQKDHSYIPAGYTHFFYDTPAGFHNTSFEVGTDYQFDSSHMAYVRFAQGYEAGGFTGFPGAPNGGASFQPETNNAYEIGFKSDWFDKRLRFNIDFFLNELSQLQVESVEPAPPPVDFLQITNNAGSATIKGVEAQIVAVPVDPLTLRMNLGYLETNYDKYQGTVCSPTGVVTDCSGIPFAYAPRWTISIGGDYVMDLPRELGTATFALDWNYKSSLYVSEPPTPDSRQEGYGLVNASVTFHDQDEKYGLEFYGTNILDRHYKNEVSDSGGLTFEEDDGRPAEWGIKLTAKF